MNPELKKIKLRALEPEDVDLLYIWENDPEIWKVSNTVAPFSRYVLMKYIESSHQDIYETRQLRLMIDLTVNSNHIKTIGAIDIFDFEPLHQRAGIGVLIGESVERGKGYADLALKKLIEYCFNTLYLNQVYCNISTSNTPSIRLFKKNGFHEIGIKKSWNKTKNGYVDEIMLQLISTNN
jgi:diamine N-acetyltransferase